MPEDPFSENNYGIVSRLLHRLVLDHSFVGEMLFDIEQVTSRQPGGSPGARPIFIVGLARSGTTALLETIYATGAFRSLTYNDMPFVLMPSLGRRLSRLRAGGSEKTERAHGDGILVNADSPEAFEEVFWRTFCGASYIREEGITPHDADEETLEKFRLFVSSVIKTADDPGHTRYLSKNNNNLLRLPSVRKAFPDAAIIVPFRDPVQQALSLRNQHRLFCQRHESDAFSLQYMNWLAHHEFGLGHRPFLFHGVQEDVGDSPPEELDYWLSIWNRSYQHVLRTADEDTYFLCFERLCEHTATELARLCTWADIPCDGSDIQSDFVLPPAKKVESGDTGLISSCSHTYQAMVERSGHASRQE